MHAHHTHTPDTYAASIVGDCDYCGEPVALKDAERLLLHVNSTCHATCYAQDRDAWTVWAHRQMLDDLPNHR